MKIEVGKKYICNRGHLYEIYAKHPLGHFRGYAAGQGMYGIEGEFREDGNGLGDRSKLVKEYTEPKTQEVWVIFFQAQGVLRVDAFKSREMADATMKTNKELGFVNLAIKKVTLTEGEFDNE